jgi:uncharacterized membrane protein YqaE (UPF0057 family)
VGVALEGGFDRDWLINFSWTDEMSLIATILIKVLAILLPFWGELSR